MQDSFQIDQPVAFRLLQLGQRHPRPLSHHFSNVFAGNVQLILISLLLSLLFFLRQPRLNGQFSLPELGRAIKVLLFNGPFFFLA